ncbi:MAG: DUF3710 domain-containing protein [Micrococcales bacterium]|nr:DUF3710 domain-containing protein [Micrococcales bacterium]
MGLFRRVRPDDEPDADRSAPDTAPQDGDVPPQTGPWDSSDPRPAGPYLDLGGLQVPVPSGLKVHMDTDDSRRVVRVRMEVAGSELQLAPFAAPRTAGIWDEIRAEIVEQIQSDGGRADEMMGRFGLEVAAKMVVRSEGKSGKRTVRFLGVDGPRWFLRGVVTGAAASDPTAAAVVEDLFAGCVVVRGTAAMPPRDLLVMRLPDEAPVVEPDEPEFDPLTRGPEITEIR